MMPAEPIVVLITAIGGGGHGEQILKALRLAESGRYRIIGADINPACPQFSLVDEAIILPRADAPEFIDAVIHVCRHFQVKALFHGCEPELKAYAAERARIQAEGIFLPINPDQVIATCMNKLTTANFLTESGFVPPHYWVLKCAADAERVDQFPVVVKPFVGSGGSTNCFIAQTSGELQKLVAYLEESGLLQRLMVQEYVGVPEQEFTVGVLLDMDGNLVNSIAVRRSLNSSMNVRIAVPNRTGRNDLGPILVVSSGVSHGEVGAFPEVTKPCEDLAVALGARGAINVQCRLADGAVKVFEINPQFSGTTSIRAMMGYNEPDVLMRRHLLGERIEPRFPYRNGLVLRGLAETIALSGNPLQWDQLA